MDLTVQIVARNNLGTIAKTIESIKPLNPTILVADLGDDGTYDICRRMGCQAFKFDEFTGHDEVRNILTDRSQTEWQLYLHPWECLVQGHSQIARTPGHCQKATIIQDSILTQEPRIWNKTTRVKFVNPIYEHLEGEGAISGICIYSTGDQDYAYNLKMVRLWKDRKPTSPQPFYYHAITLLALKQYDSFIHASEHYMFVDKRPSSAAILNRYYYALVQVAYMKKVKPALQNLNICISAYPLMAEFWCLIGDIYYHLLNKFTTAKEFYENALLLGGRRLADDGWPMDVSKYDEYPNRMIASCDEVMDKNAIYIA